MAATQIWLSSLAATAAASVISYAWLDRPIALFIHSQFPRPDKFEKLTLIPDPFIAVAVLIFVGLGLYVLAGHSLAKMRVTALLCCISVVAAEATKNQLKYVFGRTWPDTWLGDNPSFLHDGVYGFNLFHGGASYAAFPSGHLSVTAAVVSVLWMTYPQWRALYALIVAAVAVALVGANYHFLSDIIAGAFVGVSTGWMTAALWRSGQELRALPAV